MTIFSPIFTFFSVANTLLPYFFYQYNIYRSPDDYTWAENNIFKNYYLKILHPNNIFFGPFEN